MEHETRRAKKHSINVKMWSTLAIIALLVLISFQLGKVNSSLGEMESKLGSLQEFFDDLEQPAPTQPTAAAPTPQPRPSIDMDSLIDDDTVKGSKDAPVTIVEFSDFECPFCARFFEQTLPQLEKEYIETGKVKFVYRDLPLSFHANAQKAAEAAECAGEQGKFWEMHDQLFADGVSGGVSSFKQYAADLGLDQAQFDTCLDSGQMASEVQKDMRDGQAAGITGTPGFIINGQKVSGAQPFANFKAVIDAALSQ